MYNALGITTPFVYLNDTIKDEKYLSDMDQDPVYVYSVKNIKDPASLPAIQSKLNDSVEIGAGTINVLINKTVYGTLIILWN